MSTTAELSRGTDLAVIGAAGKTGTAVVAALETAGTPPVRRVVHTARRTGDRAVDLETGAGLAEALSGCSGVYFIGPNMHPDEPALFARFLRAATEAGVDHVVYHSVAWPYTPAMPHHLDKARCEDLLHTAERVRWTVLQPCAYAENFAAVLDGTTDLLEVPYDPDAPFSFVALSDVADVAARVLIEGADVHHGATYELGGPEAIGVRQLGTATGRPVAVRQVSFAEWERRHGAMLSAGTRARLRAMFDFYDRHGFVAGSTTLTALLGREPTRITDLAPRIPGPTPAGGVGRGT
ncbi:NmrA family NAD(P)-binding protein [Rhodococcus sp. Z13]|uniref:NmrA family NAD(P)-binding protein n=1 Tax=Rhodococcus sacchari TaxID=2962047 RepID=A0ACD4DF82_9NOCA|nr:NmrA family NAD(P)-binding protein [Rhodococcus sp. Z13]UYP18698.1 NmrA family NAD(P)-binding protein [Rhodococcus sp. Z13]